MHAISSYRGNRPPSHTHRQDRLQYTAPQLEEGEEEVRCVGAHPPFWPLEPARVKPN